MDTPNADSSGDEIMTWIRTQFGARTFNQGDIHNACLLANVPLNMEAVDALLTQATQRGILANTKPMARGTARTFAFRVQQ